MDRHPLLAAVPPIDPAWFRDPHGIHGVAHTTRVTALAIALADELGATPTVREAVRHAGIWHDIGRGHEGLDSAHGARSAELVLELGLAADLNPRSRDLALFAIRHHSLADEIGRLNAAVFDDCEEARQVLWILKDGDALDRVRLWGDAHLDPKLLRFAYSRDLIAVAEMLFAAG